MDTIKKGDNAKTRYGHILVDEAGTDEVIGFGNRLREGEGLHLR